MKRILLLIKGLSPGGAEQLLVSAAPYRDTRRFEYRVAYVVTLKHSIAGELKAAGLPVVGLDGDRGAGWMARLRALVKREQIDLIHSHLPYAAVGARLALSRREVKHVYTEHAVWDMYHKVTYWGNAATFHRNDHVFAVSQHVRRSIRYPAPLRFLPMPPVETLYHGIDPRSVVPWTDGDGVRRELGISDTAPLVGTVSNFGPMKGQEYLLDALQLVRRSFPDVRAVLVGQGRFERAMRRRAHELGLDDIVIFTGYRPDAPRIAGAFDVFALPSVKEGLSIALIEAMAQGKASVVTNAGGSREVVRDGIEGIVVPTRNHEALAGGLVNLLRDQGWRDRMGEAARMRAKDFDIRFAVRRMEEVYGELLS